MDSILVVFYSATGTTRKAAQLLAGSHGWALGEILDEKPRTGATGYLRSVLDSMLGRHPAIRYEGPDPADFHTVVLMSPVWVYRLCGPMRSFIASHRDSLHRVAVASTMGSAGASNALLEISRQLGQHPVLADAFTAREISDGSATQRLLDFADRLVPPSTSRQPHFVPAADAHTMPSF